VKHRFSLSAAWSVLGLLVMPPAGIQAAGTERHRLTAPSPVAKVLRLPPTNCPKANSRFIHGGRPPDYAYWIGERVRGRGLVGYSDWQLDKGRVSLWFGSRTRYGYFQKVFWQIVPTSSAKVILRGWNVRTHQSMWFGRPTGASPVPGGPPPMTAQRLGVVRVRNAPPFTFIPSAGCFVVQAAWAGGTWSVQFAEGCHTGDWGCH
jgi:hypothetical protein